MEISKENFEAMKKRNEEYALTIFVLAIIIVVLALTLAFYGITSAIEIERMKITLPEKVHFDNLNFIDASSNQSILIQNFTVEWKK
jgi:membrane-bound acyltransferase YfiQ involved in biofilm formation